VLIFGLAALALLVGGWLGVGHLLTTTVEVSPVEVSLADAGVVRPEQPPGAKAPTRPDGAPEQAQTRVTVEEIRGRVERRKPPEPWRTARIGDNLGTQEFVRTGPRGRAGLVVGPRARLTVDHTSEVSVREITAVTHRFRLEQGRLAVDYRRDGKRVLQIESKDGAAVARTKEASFSVLQTEETVAVATTTGQVDLSAAGKTVKVEQGQQSVVQQAAPPAAPVTIPKEILLKVARARLPARESARTTILKGQTQPGNRVLVGGKPAEVDARGRFTIKVPLQPGGNQIVVVTEDPAGRRKERVLQYFAVSSGARVDDLKVDWGKRPKLDVTWDKRPK